MFSSFTSSWLQALPFAVLSSLAVVDALCLPCQVGLVQTPLSPKTPSSPPSRRGVYSPPITNPDASTRWARGTEALVTWSTSNMPQEVTNTNGRILLGYLEEGSSNEHLDVAHPLAEGFNIHDGSCKIRVPDDIPMRDNYIIVLMGDSGNKSPAFTIV
ncbi:hypothetical protein C8F04DRAFT_1400680 [Mycena alexandri]|uniref:Purple acid phosphatase N-terminal domain-containing protein n=1 Tax=Mycena alexandri TaxID=1745969 RepID=A0AAD6SCX0_9AGAR|nr:hypothetical protein C8F04DRAFT_1164195 [Mycena alexandri]KAJ7025408.1 hypothetical protein C8F04DRAFT_1400680 [Mycena alexandri]